MTDGRPTDAEWPSGDADAGPQWPSGDEPRWPTAAETTWERAPHDVSRRRESQAPEQPSWPTEDDAGERRPQASHGRRARSDDPDAPETQNLPPIDPSAYELEPQSAAPEPDPEPEPPREVERAVEPERPARVERPTHNEQQSSEPEPEERDPEAERRINALLSDSDGALEDPDDTRPSAVDRARSTGAEYASLVGDKAKAAGTKAKAGVAAAAAAAAGLIGAKNAKSSARDEDNSDEGEQLVYGTAVEAGGSGDDPEAGRTAALAAGEHTPKRKRRRKKRSKGNKFVRFLVGCLLIFFVLPAAIFALMYFIVDVPSPEEIAAEQAKTVTYQYSDGKVIGKDVSEGSRQPLQADDIPENVKHAVYAAEDASFETNSGFDVSGIVRAARNQLTGGSGGGSTITQQYIKTATQNDERTLIRKGLEVVKAFKMSNELEKKDIITAYLNTIYFGRGAYGIEAAAKAYFDKPAKKLSKSESAYLAGIIQSPGRGDDEAYTEARWNYVLDQMVKGKWMDAEEREKAKVPKPVSTEKTKVEGFEGPERHIKDRVTAELKELGYSESDIRVGGYTIETTIDQHAQGIAEDVVKQVMNGEPKNLHEALVAVDPNSGGIRAYYGGPYENKDYRDWANTARHAGSTIKPFDFTALLKKGAKGPYDTYDGSSPRIFGNMKPVHNSDGMQCPMPCSVKEAMTRSINTVFYDMVFNDVTPKDVATAARQAGISDRSILPKDQIGIAIGAAGTEITPRDMANGFATFAAQGVEHDAHFVSKVTAPDGEVVYDAETKGKSAFAKDREKSKQIAGNVQMTLEDVAEESNRHCPPGHPCGMKTGTHEYVPKKNEVDEGDNSQAWTAGYTRHIAVAGWVGSASNEKIRSAAGAKIYGKDLPAGLWQYFMDRYHLEKQLPAEQFDQVQVIGKQEPPPSTSSGPGQGGVEGDNPEGGAGEQQFPQQQNAGQQQTNQQPQQTFQPPAREPDETTRPEPTEGNDNGGGDDDSGGDDNGGGGDNDSGGGGGDDDSGGGGGGNDGGGGNGGNGGGEPERG